MDIFNGLASWASGASKTLTGSGSTTNLSTATFFKSSNKTVKTLNVSFTGGMVSVESAADKNGDSHYNSYFDPPGTASNVLTLTLNVPPAFTESFSLTNDFSGVPYANMTTANVSLSGLTAYYGGDFTGVGKAVLTIGSQSVTVNNPTNTTVLSIALDTAGTFTPTVSVTDSRGQTTTHTLSSITVEGYSAPSVAFNTQVERTDANGVPADEGAYAVINPAFTFTDAIATLSAPTVVVTDDSGTVQTGATVTWYSTRANNGTLSGSVNWGNLSTGATVYGLISNTNGLSTQKSYQIAVTPQDDTGPGTTKSQTVGSAYYTIDFLAGGHGVAFGKAAYREGFDCDMDPFFMTWVGIVQQFAGSTAPHGWLICDGSAVSRTTYSALFSVIGTTYGTGDGSTTFNLPDLQGRVAIGSSGTYALGATGGEATHTLSVDEIPQHRHNLQVHTSSGSSQSQSGLSYATTGYANTSFCNYTGGSQAHNNMQPYIAMNYIIYAGVYVPPTT